MTRPNPATRSPTARALMVVDRKGHVRGTWDGRRIDEAGEKVENLPKVRACVEELLRESP